MIYDCFSFFNELDLLEIRLNVLKDVVDKFIISEATCTHAGAPKPLYYEENKSRFADFHDRIIHIVVDKFPADATPWERENIQRNELVRGLVDAKPNDVLMISDLDEIPNPDIVKSAAVQPGVKRLHQMCCYYYFNMVNFVNPVLTIGTVMVNYSDFKDETFLGKCKFSEFTPESVNKGNTATLFRRYDGSKQTPIYDGGWHFSYFGGVDKVIAKIKAIAEQCYNTPTATDRELLARRIADGDDVFGRGERYFGIPLDNQFPAYILDNRDKYAKYIFPITDEYLKKTRYARVRNRLYGKVRRFIISLIPGFLVMPLYHLRARVLLEFKARVQKERKYES